MKQLEIQYFFPLTEQIELDLDFSQCSPHQYWYRAQGIAGLHGPFATGMKYKEFEAGTGLTLIENNSNLSWSQRIGDWEIQSQNKTPSEFKKFMAKCLLGWKWMGK